MAESMFKRIGSALGLGGRPPAKASRAGPFTEAGVSGARIFGGYLQRDETNSKLYGSQRWRTASELLSNVSIVAAGLRYFLNLASKPSWIVDPADESDAALEAAEFMDSVIHGCGTNWARIVRRSGMFRYHGFGIQEWIAAMRPDGRIGFKDIEPRPCHTIERWDVDAFGTVLGVWQRAPQDGRAIYLPREKIIYFVDDMMSDSPEGLGWFRNLVDPSERLKKFLKLEAIGFERDLSGIPIARAPLDEIEALREAGSIDQAQADKMVQALRDFIEMKSKNSETGLMLPSTPYIAETDTGENVSTTMKWGLELLTGEATSIEALGKAIDRLTYDMARVIGVENMLTGSDGAGSRALSEDKSRNLYLAVNSTLVDMAETMTRDAVDPIWALNGLPDELKPKLRVEDASFKDIEQITSGLQKMAAAGAVLAPDDPAIDDLRDLMGVSRQPEMTPERMGMLMPTPESQALRDPKKPEDEE